MYRFFMLLFLFGSLQLTYAQRKGNPSEANKALAKELKALLEDKAVIVKDKTVTISFDRNKQTNKLEAVVARTVELLNINSSARLQFPVFYDSESTVEEFSLRSEKGRFSKVYVKDESIKSADIFHNDYRVQYMNLNFPLQGYNRVLKTEKRYADSKYFTSQYFTDSYYTLKGTVVVHVPNWLELEIKEFNFEGYTIDKKETVNDKGKIITYSYEKLDARVSDENALGPSFVYPHLLFITKSFEQKGERVTLFSGTEDLYKWYNDLVESVDVDTSVFAEKVKELTAGATSEEEKIKNIFYWVQDQIRYIAFEDGIAGFKPDSPQNVYTKRYGDCKGMAMLTKTMLEEAGFKASLVWIGTDRLAYDYSIPSLAVDNHMICAVQFKGETIFLDGTEKYSRFGDYASRIQAKQALVQDNDSFKVLTVPSTEEVQNEDIVTYALQVEGQSLVGAATRTFTGETRVSFQNIYHTFGREEKTDALTRYLGGGNKNYYVDAIVPFDEENRDAPLKIEYTATLDNTVTEFDGTLYIDIDPNKRGANWTIEDRNVPFKHHLKQKIATHVALSLPEEYTITDLPANLQLDNDLFTIQVNYTSEVGVLTYSNEMVLKKRVIPVSQFALWNAAIEQLKEHLNQQITLTKN